MAWKRKTDLGENDVGDGVRLSLEVFAQVLVAGDKVLDASRSK